MNKNVRKAVAGTMVEFEDGTCDFIPESAMKPSPLKLRTAAVVQYCDHGGTFVADLYKVAGAVVVRAAGPVNSSNLIRLQTVPPTHHLRDYPVPTFWRPDLGIFVVPEAQILLK